MLEDVPQWLETLGKIAGSIVVIGGLLAALSRARPVKWVWRQLVSAPVTRWQAGVIAGHVDPVREDVAALSTKLTTHMGEEESLRRADASDRERRQRENDEWKTEVRRDMKGLHNGLDTMNARLGTTNDRIDTVHERIDDTLTRLVGEP